MSQLDEIKVTIPSYDSNGNPAPSIVSLDPEAKQQIKDLFKELIGENEEVTRIDRKVDTADAKEARNDFRDDLRHEVEEL